MATDKLNKAIKLHKEHMKKPSTATPKSQEKLMDLMKEHKKEMVVPRKKP
jgi:hypothetical protein